MHQVPGLLGTTENELGLRKWLEDQGHTLVTTSDKEGENSKFDQELVDAEIIITTPYVHERNLSIERENESKNKEGIKERETDSIFLSSLLTSRKDSILVI